MTLKQPMGTEPMDLLIAKVSGIDFAHLHEFRRLTDAEVAQSIKGMIVSSEAREALAEVTRDCQVLMEDLRLAGSAPSAAWGKDIFDDRNRALESIRRLATVQSRGYVSPGSTSQRRR
jgi:hypothetical protein